MDHNTRWFWLIMGTLVVIGLVAWAVAVAAANPGIAPTAWLGFFGFIIGLPLTPAVTKGIDTLLAWRRREKSLESFRNISIGMAELIDSLRFTETDDFFDLDRKIKTIDVLLDGYVDVFAALDDRPNTLRIAMQQFNTIRRLSSFKTQDVRDLVRGVDGDKSVAIENANRKLKALINTINANEAAAHSDAGTAARLLIDVKDEQGRKTLLDHAAIPTAHATSTAEN